MLVFRNKLIRIPISRTQISRSKIIKCNTMTSYVALLSSGQYMSRWEQKHKNSIQAIELRWWALQECFQKTARTHGSILSKDKMRTVD